ncbi:MAG: magnesium-translocating P-type ATPase [Thermoleophilia bacterium]|nr:magnesium-translocating P-type ATPase [Thermoleophilia bacterium]
MVPEALQSPFWTSPAENLLTQIGTRRTGLASEEAADRLLHYGRNTLRASKRADTLALLLRQFKSPIVLILILAAVLSAFLKDRVDAGIILGIVLLSSLLSFWQERGATNAVKKLLAVVEIKVTVLRDGTPVDVPVEEVVPGDVVLLNAGDVIPGDCLVLESKELFADEAALTGESYPAEKQPGVLPADTPLAKRTNCLFMGTHVISGTGVAVVVHTGKGTEFGQISEHLRLRPAETEFEHGVRRFGYFLAEVTMVLVFLIFGFNVYLNRPVLDSFLFSLALAVGLTPQLLPAIISVNLARGAKRMADKKVIVKRLAAIENLGSMNILCSDKTGTLTEGEVRLHAALDANGRESERVLLLAYLNAFYETGFQNPIDAAIRNYRTLDVSDYAKLDEIPYDFARKRLSVLVRRQDVHLLITKGPLTTVLDVCTKVEILSSSTSNGLSAPVQITDIHTTRAEIEAHYAALSGEGYRVLGIAYREVGEASAISRADEKDMTFAGFLAFFDPPKEGVTDTLRELRDLGVRLVMITGDNPLVAANVASQIGLGEARVMTASDLHDLSDEALRSRVTSVDVFAEIEPNQKERIILALRKAGNVVGYMGDGINDASALHAADVSISVNTAADVAKEAADFVLLEKDLAVVGQGVREGRHTFANTLKYVFMATSANFGNMFSMAGASLFLSFLPLLPKQVLLTNLMTDFPEMTIASDNVDPEMVAAPRRWDIRFIRRFMLVFGLLSSVFDYATFGALLLIFHASSAQFRTGWFTESVISAALVVLVIRTRRPIFRSMPSWKLLSVTLLVATVVVVIPFTPLASPLGFVRIPPLLYVAIAAVIAVYIGAAEVAKRLFYRPSAGRRHGG